MATWGQLLLSTLHRAQGSAAEKNAVGRVRGRAPVEFTSARTAPTGSAR